MEARHIALMAGIVAVLIVVVLQTWVFNSGLNQRQGLFIVSEKQKTYYYEVCNAQGVCVDVPVERVVLQSAETNVHCNPEGLCENVPTNQLLNKEGTDKNYCGDAPYLASDYVDNWWNANGLIDDCEMPKWFMPLPGFEPGFTPFSMTL